MILFEIYFLFFNGVFCRYTINQNDTHCLLTASIQIFYAINEDKKNFLSM